METAIDYFVQFIAFLVNEGLCTGEVVFANNELVHVSCKKPDGIHIIGRELTGICGFITGHIEMQ